MIRRPPRSTRTDTLFPYTTLFRSHKLGDALRETGFQDKYDGIIRDYRNAAALPDGEEALHALDAEGIAEVAAGQAREFEDHVLTELIAYQPRIVETAKATLIETRNDIIKDIGKATPGLGTVISEIGRAHA